MSDFLYIDHQDALERLCAELNGSPWLALDTEFIRDRTYFPRLCLLQVATDKRIACIDPLALDDLSPLLELLFEPSMVKVLHAARQDLEIIFHLTGRLPAPVFDTQLAATLLGHGDQVGYGALVQAELAVRLEKAHARADWCQRPLEPEQLSYAADDVRYLGELYRSQRTALERSGRLAWLEGDFALLSDPANYRIDPEQVWQRVKGTNRLTGRQLAALQQLARWRELQAQEVDLPRRWVLKDEVMVDLARAMPTSRERLSRFRGLEEGAIRRHGKEILACIERAQSRPRSDWPQAESGPRPSPEQEPLVDAAMAILRESCRRHQVSPAAVAGRRDLERLVCGERDLPLLAGWRAAVAGNAVRAFLEGDVTLRYNGRQLDFGMVPNA